MSNEAGTQKSGGFFSKVMHLVRGKEEGSLEAMGDTLGLDSRQELRQTMQRKRRNDAIRLQEFAQLRQARVQGAQGQPIVPAPAPVQSFLPVEEQENTLKSTQTLRKIDVIEAQMSSQWWGDGDVAKSLARKSNAQAPSLLGEMPDAQAAIVATSTQERRAVEFQPHPDLEEPAILFAHGDAAAARTRLLEHLAQVLGSEPVDPQQAAALWHASLDLCRATGDEETFEPLAIDYAAHFGRSAPLWTSLPAQLGMAPLYGSQMPQPAARKGQWQSPAGLTTASVTALQAAIGRASPPWGMSWQRLHSIDEAALPALAQLLHRWAEQKGQFVWSHAGVLLQLLQQHTVPGQGDVSPQWWLLRMAVLRFVHRMDDYEQVALDYCVTYEVSPPQWQEPLHQCLVEEEGEADLTTLHDSSLLTGMDAAQGSGSKASAPLQLPMLGDGLFGILEGDVQEPLEAIEAKAGTAPGAVDVDCSLLIRLDFVAAGGLLNWAASMQDRGYALRFVNLHQLTAAFMHVIGVQEHAKLVLRAV